MYPRRWSRWSALRASLTVLSLFLLLPLPAWSDGSVLAQDSQDDSNDSAEPFDDEILVTARRREENVQQIPISIITFGSTELEERSMSDISDLGKFVPNLSFTAGPFGNSSSEGALTIRGIGQIDTAIFADPAVGIYVDGVFLSRAQGSVLDLLDLERVEVLRGPQGTLFGKNTTGGALSLVTRKPSDTFAGRLSGTFGDFSRLDLRASASGRLSDGIFASVALLSADRNGYGHSLANGQEFNDDNRQAARLALHFQPRDNLTVDWVSDFSRTDESGSNQILLSVVDADLLVFYNNAKVAAGLDPVTTELFKPASFYDSYATAPSFVEGDTYGSALTFNFQASPSLNFQSITSWRGFDFKTAGDGDTTPTRVAEIIADTQHDQASQEIHFSGLSQDDKLNWLVGGLYFRERPRDQASALVFGDLFAALEGAPGAIFAPPGVPDFLCNPGPPPPGLPCFGGAGNPANLAFFPGFGDDNFINLVTESWAIFGEATYDLGPKLSATLGVRYSRDDKEFDYLSLDVFGAVDSDLSAEDNWDAVTPRLSLAYQAQPNVLLYFTASNGYKSGGFNGRPQQRNVLDPYDPEEVWSYEVGFKSDLANRRLRLNGAAFFNDYTDIQFGASLDVNGVPVFVTQNAGNAEISGFELDANVYVGGLTLSAGVGYTDTELTELDPAVPAGLREGGTLPKTPEWTATSSLQYTWRLEKSAVIARGDYSYRGEEQNDIANSPGIVQEAVSIWNARLLYAPMSDKWDIAAFVTNLTDEEYLINGFFAAAFGFNIGTAARPREWGLSVQWRF